jgi:hypothetical protein
MAGLYRVQCSECQRWRMIEYGDKAAAQNNDWTCTQLRCGSTRVSSKEMCVSCREEQRRPGANLSLMLGLPTFFVCSYIGRSDRP